MEEVTMERQGGCDCRGSEDGHGEESKGKERTGAGGGAEEVVVERCIIAVDDTSVDRALVTALLRPMEEVTMERQGGCDCRGSEDGHGVKSKGKERTGAGRVVPVVVGDGGGAEEVVEPCVIAVDDTSVDRALVTALLRRSKCRVTTVDSGKKALEILGSEPNVRMIITDYWMPEMTGYDLLKKVKESSELKHIPVVIMSSENVPTRITRCLEEGAEDFLLKPVRPSDISRITARMLH